LPILPRFSFGWQLSCAISIYWGWGLLRINIKETYTNSGGYFAVCGAIFITCSKTKVD
jgi:hypothetical protein